MNSHMTITGPHGHIDYYFFWLAMSFAAGGRKKKSNRELAKNLLDISASVKEAANGLLNDPFSSENLDREDPEAQKSTSGVYTAS